MGTATYVEHIALLPSILLVLMQYMYWAMQPMYVVLPYCPCTAIPLDIV